MPDTPPPGKSFNDRLADGLLSGCLASSIDLMALTVASVFAGAYFGLVYGVSALVLGGLVVWFHRAIVAESEDSQGD